VETALSIAKAYDTMKLHVFAIILSLIALAFSAGVAPVPFGPQTGASWSLSSGQFTAFQFTVLTPPTLTWTPPAAYNDIWATFFEPSLSNSQNYAWSYSDQLTYQNFSGPAVIPPYYILEFEPAVNTAYPTPIVANVHVYPGDTITVGFTKSGATWNQAWSVVRGAKGKAAGATASSGSSAYTFPAAATFNLAELGAYFIGTFWDFGPITWSNIKLTASTTDTSWCTPTPASIYTPAFNATYPNGLSVAATSGGFSTCTLPTMIWPEPPGALTAEAAYIVTVDRCLLKMSEGGVCTY